MQHVQNDQHRSLIPLRAAYWISVMAVGISLAACGGGGGTPTEAVVSSVEADVSVLEGSAASGTSDLVFLVSLDKPVITRLDLTVSTRSAIKPGFVSTPGAATGGASCGAGTDYINLSNEPIVFLPGSSSGQITVKVCQDSTFEPNEILYVDWSVLGGQVRSLKGTIINDDAGGLNSTGASSLLGGLSAFGRDVNTLTQDNGDGALGFSFASVNSGACIQDKVTGLTWQKNWPITGIVYSGADALVDNANSTFLCGKTDWRVPTSNELLSLMNFSVPVNNPINADVLNSLLSGDWMTGEFWTSETMATATDNAWVVSPGQGGVVSFLAKTASTPFVRLVSGAKTASTCVDSADRFIVSRNSTGTPDSTVYDSKSGLMWKQCTEGSEGAQCNLTSTVPFDTSRSEAATYIFNWLKNVNANPATLGAGFSDWRLPSVKELASLVNRCSTSSRIDPTFFPNSMSVSYVTATKNVNDPSQFWFVNFFDGTIAVGSATNKYIRLVRAGQ
jgi:hypothetical protein